MNQPALSTTRPSRTLTSPTEHAEALEELAVSKSIAVKFIDTSASSHAPPSVPGATRGQRQTHGRLLRVGRVSDDERMAELTLEITHDGPSNDLTDDSPRLGSPFGPTERTVIDWVHKLGRREMFDLIASRSHFHHSRGTGTARHCRQRDTSARHPFRRGRTGSAAFAVPDFLLQSAVGVARRRPVKLSCQLSAGRPSRRSNSSLSSGRWWIRALNSGFGMCLVVVSGW